jgi:hypothetical protein
MSMSLLLLLVLVVAVALGFRPRFPLLPLLLLLP